MIDRCVLIPLRNARREVVAEAIIDEVDADLVNQWTWCLNPNGYAWRNSWAQRAVTGPHVYLHRMLGGAVRGDGMYVDHINRNRLDDRRANLRLTTPAESAQNKPALKGRFRGVNFDKARGLWRAQAQLDRRLYNLGRFATEDEARDVVVAWRREHMPFAVEDIG